MNIPMNLETLFAMLALIITVATATGGAVVFVMRKTFQSAEMRQEVDKLRAQSEQLRQQIDARSRSNDPSAFDRLRDLVKEASDALGADKASIYFSEPLVDPSRLKIVFSTDRKWQEIVGKFLLLSEGISGWVYKSKQP